MSITLAKRNLRGILIETFRLYSRNFFKLVAITAFVSPIFTIVGIAAPILSSQEVASSFSPLTNLLIPIMIIIMLFPLYILMAGALIHAICEQSFGRGIGIGSAYRFVWSRLGAMVGAELLVALAMFGMSITIIGLPVAIYYAVRWSFVGQVALLERTGPRITLSRSSKIVKGHWWRVFGIQAVVVIVYMLLSFLMQITLGLVPIFGELIAGILLAPILIIAPTLLYYDLRVRRERYGLASLAREIDFNIDDTSLNVVQE